MNYLFNIFVEILFDEYKVQKKSIYLKQKSNLKHPC